MIVTIIAEKYGTVSDELGLCNYFDYSLQIRLQHVADSQCLREFPKIYPYCQYSADKVVIGLIAEAVRE